jgi:hypothetical protein
LSRQPDGHDDLLPGGASEFLFGNLHGDRQHLGEAGAMIDFPASQAFIPTDPDNIDYQEYCRFLEEGGVPTPYTPPPEVKQNG